MGRHVLLAGGQQCCLTSRSARRWLECTCVCYDAWLVLGVHLFLFMYHPWVPFIYGRVLFFIFIF